MSGKGLRVEPRPAAGYVEAMERVAALMALDGPEVYPASRTRFLGHGARVGRAIVLFHGYTNSPCQFGKLGEMLHAQGYNVLIPRAPHHGLADRLTVAHGRLRAEELVARTDEAVDAACGLGERVTVVGLSMGGVMAAWAAQERADVDRAVLIAPAFGFRVVPAALTPLVVALLRRLPNVFIRWDPMLKEEAWGLPHCYPRYATRALAEILRLAAVVCGRAREAPPAARSVLVVTNANDMAVDNALAARVVASWRRSGANSVETYEFPADLHLPHDLIDPAQPEQQVDRVYPVLVGLI